MNIVRLTIGAALGFIVTGILFVIMPTLIEMADKSLDESNIQRIDDITMPDTDINVNLADVKPPKPAEPEEPPPEMAQPDVSDVDISPDALNMTPQASVVIDIGSGFGGGGDGEYLPIFKVPPMYPRRATSRGIEGYCIVEYTVTTTGATKDVVAVDCEPAGAFERASIKAAKKFKYKPRVLDGEAIEVPGAQNRFIYELGK
ncbi:MAG: protein TonB [Pseudohongiellaceae bacterium]|jgi:protein TonB